MLTGGLALDNPTAAEVFPNVKPLKGSNFKMATLPLVSQAQLVEELADRTGQSKSVVRVMMAALEDCVVAALENSERIKVAGVLIEPKLKPASKKRMGRNPRTGEDVQIPAKPASVKLKARVLAALTNRVELPSAKSLSKKLGK